MKLPKKQWSTQLLRMAAPAAKYWKRDFSSASERAFSGGFGGFCVAEPWLPPKRGCFNTQEFTRFLSDGNWCHLSVESRALTCPFKQSNPSIWSLLSWHPTHTRLWVRLSVFLKLFVSTVTVPPSDSEHVNRSASLQQFWLIHQHRARRLRSDEGGHQYQALYRFILWEALACRCRRVRLSTTNEVGRERYWRRWWDSPSKSCDDVRCYVCWRTLFFRNCFEIEMVLCDLYLTRFDMTKNLLFDTFLLDFFDK